MAGSKGFFNAAVDAALAMQTFILAAEATGLGCCPISVIRNHADAAGEILGLPDKVFPVAGLCVGWPAREGHISLRLPPAVTLHRDHYDDAALAELVDAYDRARDRRHRAAARGAAQSGAVRLCRFLRLVGRQGAPGGATRRRRVSALAAAPRLQLRLIAI